MGKEYFSFGHCLSLYYALMPTSQNFPLNSVALTLKALIFLNLTRQPFLLIFKRSFKCEF
jgi:hypothetical protein